MKENEISYQVIGKAIEIHRKIGPGLLESAYEKILYHELMKLGLKVQSQIVLPIQWDGVYIEKAYRIDLLVEDKLIIELKSVDQIAKVHLSQLKTYLKLSNLKLGLIINFRSELLRDGIHRVVNNLEDEVDF
ncbi:MAG: GxxExxY protein [Mongoliibacter sp.]|uniref:GxxExxY protein n=1 Tax=Mongoliibacter sp. TaxID=2022438 RepID=UPI0012EF431E|nr:GxxExxY protein [Mongoliibacter sp.]TVP43711.1 MAG: GxxExxY protein [Mongoliibacter sp.]